MTTQNLHCRLQKKNQKKNQHFTYSHIVKVHGFKEVDFDVYIPMEHELLEGKFPDGFMIGTASASYQIEGAWNESGKCYFIQVKVNVKYLSDISYCGCKASHAFRTVNSTSIKCQY